jgi:hypothetical protein
MTVDKAGLAALGRLKPFVGSWDTTGEMKSPAPGQATTFKAFDKYEWLPGGGFLLHHFDADMPDGKVHGIEVIGYDAEADDYSMHAFDCTGTVSVMHGRVEKDIWTFVSDAMRFTGGFREDGSVFGGLWESRASGEDDWQPAMEITLRKRNETETA